MSTLENLLENPDEWEVIDEEMRLSRSYRSKIQVCERFFLFYHTTNNTLYQKSS